MSQETQSHDPTLDTENSENAPGRPIKRVIQGLGLTLLGAAAALPVICIYLTKRMLRKGKRPLASKGPTAEPKTSGSHPIRIPIQIEKSQPPEPAGATPAPEEYDTPEGATPPPEAAVRYVASTESDKFHDPQCRWAHQIHQEHRINLTDREEALARGLVPCGTCRP
jgi:hypothetical protein